MIPCVLKPSAVRKFPDVLRLSLHTSSVVYSRSPRRYRISSKAGPKRGNPLPDEYIDRGVQPIGHHFYDENGHRYFKTFPEMIPELIVPDLENFELRPYVSYRTLDVAQPAFTAKDLFDACYAKDIVEKVKKGEIDVADIVLKSKKNSSS